MPRIGQALALVVLLSLATPALAAAQAPPATSTKDVELVRNIARHTDTSGAVLHDGHYYITTERDLSIYDVADPLNPTLTGSVVLEAIGTPIFTEEDPTTNGKLLVISNGDTLVYDVSDKSNPTIKGVLPGLEQHTMQCILDCTWVYGSEGAIVDLRDPANPKLADRSWRDDLGAMTTSTHDVTEVAPGIILTATEPLLLLDARADPVNPKLLAKGKTPGFAHATLWPHGGTDDFALVGGEATGPNCANAASATFMTFDARGIGRSKDLALLDEFRVPKGAFVDGTAPDSTYCVHWFDPHPTYANGGLVAIAWYEQGTRFLKIDAAGQIEEVGHYLPTGGQSSDVDWITPEVAYIADYLRGLDIVRFTGAIPASFPRPVAPGAMPPGVPPGMVPAATPTPAAKPAAEKPRTSTFLRLVRMPPTKTCIRASSFRVRARTHGTNPVVSLTVKVAGRRRTGKGTSKLVRRGVKPGAVGRRGARVTVAVTAVTKRGTTVRGKRTYRVCAR